VLVALTAELRAFGLEHRRDRLHAELVHQGEKVSTDHRRERQQHLRKQRRLASGGFFGRLLHGGSFRFAARDFLGFGWNRHPQLSAFSGTCPEDLAM
jgi:hypothetical protein